MLSFTSSLTNAFKRDNFQGYWLFKLYYGNESSFTGVSDIPREKGGDKYFGAVLGNTGLNQSCGIDSFRVRHGTMTLTIRNDLNSIEGLRFSDLYDSREYANRKWELIQGDEYATFSADNIIASGIISDRTPAHDVLTCTIYLDDWWIKYNIELPVNTIDLATYPNAPEKNIGKPFPIWIGDYQTDNTTPALNTYEYQKNKVPAIITNKWNDDETGFTLYPDIEIIKEVTNVFFYNKDQWAVTSDSPTVNNPEVIVKGTTCKAFYSLTAHEDKITVGTCPDYEDAFDMDGDTDATWNIEGVSGPGGYIAFSIPDTISQSLGKNISAVTVKLWGSLIGTVTDDILMKTYYEGNQIASGSININAGLNEYNYTGMFSADDLQSWSLGIDIVRIYVSNVENMVMYINEIGIEIEFIIDKTYLKTHYQEVEIDDRDTSLIGQGYGAGGQRVITTSNRVIGDIEAVYVTGEGRIFGSWIDADSRNNGYNENGLIENPVYIIESILRDELGLTSNEIDYASFDTAGNTTNGKIGNVFNDAVSDIKFAFSQYEFINAKDFIYKLCKFSGLYFWWGADGKAKIRARERTYSSVDMTIDYEKDIAFRSEENPSIPLIKSFKTPLSDVINYITVNYNYDYGSNQTVKSSTPDDNANLRNNTSRDAYSVDSNYRKATVDFRYTLDETTANNLGEAQIGWFKDRKNGVRFPALKPNLNALEYGDIVKFTNWDVNHKVWGETITSSMAWIIVEPMKNNNNAMIGVIRVPGSV